MQVRASERPQQVNKSAEARTTGKPHGFTISSLRRGSPPHHSAIPEYSNPFVGYMGGKNSEPTSIPDVLKKIEPAIDTLTQGEGEKTGIDSRRQGEQVVTKVDILVDPKASDPLNNPYHPQNPYPNKQQT